MLAEGPWQVAERKKDERTERYPASSTRPEAREPGGDSGAETAVLEFSLLTALRVALA